MAIDSFKKVEGASRGDIKIFALSTCGWCRKTKAYLSEHGIAYSYIDVDQLPSDIKEVVSMEHKKFNPRGTYPTIVFNESEAIIGYDLEFLDRLTKEE